MVSDTNASAGGNTINLSSTAAKNVCASHDSVYDETAQWLIQIQLDKDVYDASNFAENYYSKHLQSTGPTDVRTNFSDYNAFREKVLINGKTINQLYALSTNRTDWSCFLHLEVTESNVLRIMIPKDNTYGFNGDGNFTVQAKSGLVMNGVSLNPFTHTHIAEVPQSITFTAPKVVLNSATKAELSGSYVYIYLKDTVTKPKMKLSGQTDSLLQDITRSSTDSLRELTQDICSYIKINGENIGDGNVRATHFASAMVQTYAGDGNVLRLQFDASNVYNITPTNRCTIEITAGLAINGYTIEPAVYHYDGIATASLSQGYWAAVTSYTGGTVSPTNPVSGALITSSQNTLQAGDTVRVKVEPGTGYQIKAGSLNYTYWYKGELITKPISMFVGSDSTADYYDFESPDVIGVIDAEFVAVDETVNFNTLGVQNRTSGQQGLRFVNRLYLDNIDLVANTVTISGEVCTIKDYGVEIGIYSGDFNWANAYKAQTKVIYSGSKFIDFTAEIVNIEQANYGIAFVTRAYFTYVDVGGVDHSMTSDGVIRSVNDCFK